MKAGWSVPSSGQARATLFTPPATGELMGNLSRIGDYYTGDVKGLTGLLTGPAVLVGTGAWKYLVQINDVKDVMAIEAAPSGAGVARLAARRLDNGDRDDVLSLTPLYLKESTAKVLTRPHPSTSSG